MFEENIQEILILTEKCSFSVILKNNSYQTVDLEYNNGCSRETHYNLLAHKLI